jgi:N6-L-threonylcarbamoyladenine synthase
MSTIRILAIETSCDETAVALLVRKKGSRAALIADEVYSQTDIHRDYGGVVPELAAREHMKILPLMVAEVFQKTKLTVNDLDAIAVTRGPGLKGCLLMGLCFAKGLALSQGIPLIGVNHIEGHVFAPCISHSELKTPFLSLIVSGGHTEIVRVEEFGRYTILDRTIDDAAGEAFDKSANLLGIDYPGGPKLAELADQYCGPAEPRFKLPVVMKHSRGFSFSGLKTAIAILIANKKNELKKEDFRIEMAYAIQKAIVDALVFKIKQALKVEARSLPVTLTGGVSANEYLRKEVSGIADTEVIFPDKKHCIDNAAMIAWVGSLRWEQGEVLDPGASVLSRWPLEELSI